MAAVIMAAMIMMLKVITLAIMDTLDHSFGRVVAHESVGQS